MPNNNHDYNIIVRDPDGKTRCWISETEIHAGTYYLHEVTTYPVDMRMSLEEAKQLFKWLKTIPGIE